MKRRVRQTRKEDATQAIRRFYNEKEPSERGEIGRIREYELKPTSMPHERNKKIERHLAIDSPTTHRAAMQGQERQRRQERDRVLIDKGIYKEAEYRWQHDALSRCIVDRMAALSTEG